MFNLYFDLVEIERRNMEREIQKSNKHKESIDIIYTSSVQRIEKLKSTYFKEVDQGNNKSNMIKWNAIVFENLKIDNIELFKPYEKNE